LLAAVGWPAEAAAAEPPPADEAPAVAAAEGGRDAGREPSATSEPIDVVVTGKRKPEHPFQADRAVSVVSSKELAEKSPRTTPEALWDTPGVFVQQTNHGGGSPIVRGLIGPQVLLLLDGVRLNNSVYRTGPIQYLNLVDPMSLGRIEVLRGPGSVLYGSDAMGGVIQLFPHEPRNAQKLSEVEGHGATQLRFESASKAPGAHARAEIGVQGFGVLAAGSVRALDDLRGGRGVGVQPYSGYHDYSTLGSVQYHFGDGPLDGASTKATYLYSRLDGAGRTDKLYDSNSLQIYDNELHLLYDRWHFEIDAIHTAIDITPSYQRFFERKDAIQVEDDYVTRLDVVRDEVLVHTFGLDGALETSLVEDRLALRYGGMFYNDWVDAQRLEQPVGGDWTQRVDQSYPSGSTYLQFGAYALVEAVPVVTDSGDRLGVRAGYRFHGMGGDAPAQVGLAAADFSHVGHVAMGAVQYSVADTATVALSFEQGFRAPNLQEAVQLGDTGKFFHVPNDDLGPEKSNTFELLTRVRHGWLDVSWAGFVSRLDDLIIREPTAYQGQTVVGGKDVFHNVNAERGLLTGMEAGVGVELGHGFSARGQASYAFGKEYRDDGSVPLSRIPPLFGLASVRYDTDLPDRWRGFIETYLRWAMRQKRLSPEDESDARIPEGGTPGWWTWNVRTGLAGHDRHRLVLAIENLLDQRYKYHASGVYAAGTNAIMSYEARF
jgi:outer membrane receptor protein involved in Fe transport